MIKLNKEGFEELCDNYDPMQLICAIDALDEVQCIFRDEEAFKSPEVRIQLLRIHELIFKQLCEGLSLSDEEVDELSLLIGEADMTMFEIIDELEKIREALRPLRERMFVWEE